MRQAGSGEGTFEDLEVVAPPSSPVGLTAEAARRYVGHEAARG